MTKFVRRAQETGKELAGGVARGVALSARSRSSRSTPSASRARPTRSTACTARATTWPTARARGASRTSARTSAAGAACSPPIQGWYTVASGMADVVLVVAEEKMSSCQPHPQGAFLTIFDNIIERPLGPEPALDLRARDEPVHEARTGWTSATSPRWRSRTSGTPPTIRPRCWDRPTSRSRTCSRARPSPGRCSASTSRRSATAPSRS